MLPFKLIYSDEYYLPIGQHVFPAEKYRRIYRRLIETGVADSSDFLTPSPLPMLTSCSSTLRHM